MPRLHHVKKARKDNKQHGIEKGDEYWWAGYRSGRTGWKKYWKTHPKPSQVVSSGFQSELMSIEEDLTETAVMADGVHGAVEQLRNLASEQEDKHSNMPEGLQDGPTGELLIERARRCEEISDELDEIVCTLDDQQQDEDRDDEGCIDLAEAVSNIDWAIE